MSRDIRQCSAAIGDDGDLAGRLLRQSRYHVAGFGHEAEAFFDVPQGRFVAEIGGGRAAAILDKHAIVAEEMRVGQRVQHALIGVDAAEKDSLHLEIAQDAVERRVPKTADAELVDFDVFRQLFEFIDHSRRPTVLLQKMRAVPG